MFGMAGGFAGQFLVAPAITAGLPWSRFWVYMGVAGLVLGVLLFASLPRTAAAQHKGGWVREAGHALATVFRNPQSIMCGLIAGLIFIPTTIFDMVWGVRYLQEGHGFDYGEAVMRSSMVPLGWIIGCPLLGFISDRLGRRKPVILVSALVLLACLGWILFGPHEQLPPYVVGFVAGVSSGAAMIPYTVIKEANPANMGGTATGVINFLNFTLSALLGPLFSGRLGQVSAGAERNLEHYQSTFWPLLIGVAIAIVLTLLLRETGPAARRAAAATTS
jgi:sugar phosphate permease